MSGIILPICFILLSFSSSVMVPSKALLFCPSSSRFPSFGFVDL